MSCLVAELMEPPLYIAFIIIGVVAIVIVGRYSAHTMRRSALLSQQAEALERSNNNAEREFIALKEAADRLVLFQCAMWLLLHNAEVRQEDVPSAGQRVTQIVENY